MLARSNLINSDTRTVTISRVQTRFCRRHSLRDVRTAPLPIIGPDQEHVGTTGGCGGARTDSALAKAAECASGTPAASCLRTGTLTMTPGIVLFKGCCFRAIAADQSGFVQDIAGMRTSFAAARGARSIAASCRKPTRASRNTPACQCSGVRDFPRLRPKGNIRRNSAVPESWDGA